MDPVSIAVLANASLGIARSLVHTVKDLYELAESYETAALGIRTVATQCNSFRVAVQRINTWLNTQNESTRGDLDEDFWQALSDNLETGRLVLEDLEKRIKGLKKNPAKFWIRTKYLWNSVVISELQHQIQSLMSAISMLLKVIDIPSPVAKRSHSLAQRSRLNNLTMSVRLTVDQRRERIRKTQEQDLLDDIESESVPTNLQEPLQIEKSVAPLPSTLQASRTNMLSSQEASAPSRSQRTMSEGNFRDGAPPPYESYIEDRSSANLANAIAVKDIKMLPESNFTEKDVSSRAADPSEGSEDRSKRSKWNMMFKKRSSGPRESGSSRSLSDPPQDGSNSGPKFRASARVLDPSDELNKEIQATPAAIADGDEKHEYFDLQQAMMGMSFDPSTQFSLVESEVPGDKGEDQIKGEKPPAELTNVERTELEATFAPITASPPPDDKIWPTPQSILSTVLPVSQKAPFDFPKRENSSTDYGGLNTISQNMAKAPISSPPSYYPPPPNSHNSTESELASKNPSSPPRVSYSTPRSEAFDRIRPSQRVRASHERSQSYGPTNRAAIASPDPTNASSTTTRQPQQKTSTLSSLTPTQQTWRTTPILASSQFLSLSSSNTLRLMVSFDPSTFTSQISTPAARALHLLDSAIHNCIDNTPIATLNLLYTIEDGSEDSEPQVMADELEMEVMHEEESRSMEIRFGADQMMIRDLMEETGHLHWSERPVPKGLRTVERLRMFRKFELWRW